MEKERNKKVDRRVQRTQKILAEALISLSIEKGYEAVTVQDIIDRANVGRATFYTHYENKDQLILNGQHELNGLLFGNHDEHFDFLKLYRHAAEHAKIAKVMLGYKGGELIINYLREVLLYKIKKELKSKGKKPTKNQKMQLYSCDVAATAIVRLLYCWFQDNMPLPPEEMAKKSDEILDALL